MSTYWYLWFAWRPVWTIDRGWVWLRPVHKRHVPPKVGIPWADWTFDYRVRCEA